MKCGMHELPITHDCLVAALYFAIGNKEEGKSVSVFYRGTLLEVRATIFQALMYAIHDKEVAMHISLSPRPRKLTQNQPLIMPQSSTSSSILIGQMS